MNSTNICSRLLSSSTTINNNNNNNNNDIDFTNCFYDMENNNISSVSNTPIITASTLFIKEYVTIKSEEIYIEGILNYNEYHSKGLIIFVHGIGSSRFSPRNLYLSKYFQNMGYSTLLFDILTPPEERLNNITGEFKFNLNFISNRIINAIKFIILNQNKYFKNYSNTILPITLFGSSTGSAAIIECENKLNSIQGIKINNIISRSGRFSLCNKNSLGLIKTPILLICGSEDKEIVEVNKQSIDRMHNCQKKKLTIIKDATHLFPEENALENVASISIDFLNSFN